MLYIFFLFLAYKTIYNNFSEQSMKTICSKYMCKILTLTQFLSNSLILINLIFINKNLNMHNKISCKVIFYNDGIQKHNKIKTNKVTENLDLKSIILEQYLICKILKIKINLCMRIFQKHFSLYIK